MSHSYGFRGHGRASASPGQGGGEDHAYLIGPISAGWGGVFFVALFGILLLVASISWAKRVGWNIAEERALANYLGRSLGGVITAIVVVAFQAARDPWQNRILFDLTFWIVLFMVWVYGHGWIRKNQPLVEHLEIFLYGALSVLSWALCASPP